MICISGAAREDPPKHAIDPWTEQRRPASGSSAIQHKALWQRLAQGLREIERTRRNDFPERSQNFSRDLGSVERVDDTLADLVGNVSCGVIRPPCNLYQRCRAVGRHWCAKQSIEPAHCCLWRDD